MRPSEVMTSLTGRLKFFSKRKSRFVTMPTNLPSALMTGMPPMRCSRMMDSASLTVASRNRVMGSWIMPLSERLTFRTSDACWAIVMFLWITPIPPCRAIAMAIALPVTVSIAAEITGVLSMILREKGLPKVTSRGKTSE